MDRDIICTLKKENLPIFKPIKYLENKLYPIYFVTQKLNCMIIGDGIKKSCKHKQITSSSNRR